MPEGDNPLVAAPQETTNAVTGIGIAESSVDLANGISSGDWVEAGLGAFGVGLEVLSMVIDPLGTLASYGVSWLIEHVRPLKEALDWFAGDPPVIRSFSETWANVANEVNTVSQDFLREAGTGTAGWHGQAGDTYRGHATEAADALAGAGALADGISAGVMIMGEVVAFVREFIRDLVGELVGRLIAWALEVAATLGVATPVVVAQATAAISRVVKKVADLVRKLVKTISNVAPRIRKVISKLDEILAKLAKLMRRGDGSTSPSAAGSPGRQAGDAPTVRGSEGATSPSGTTTPDTPSGAPHANGSGTTTPEQAAPQGLYSRGPEGDRPQPWPPERRDPRLEYWDGPGESGRLRASAHNLRQIQQIYGIRIHPNARVGINRGLRSAYGETVPTGRGARIDIAPEAFVNEEQLARTLYHESVHADQLAGNGWRYPSTQAGHDAWENAAHAADEQWWNDHPLNRGR
ncbi:MAG TPA: hypothetical protein VFV67_02775 [Actinophytocola sp.]|uniref:WXG100 family type VII secretion target n=1 Tax=Actinophytocola sp. TaxID=1872138 RepID=UPI002DB6D943|nr:hypothetical protein [Actinophytocola sp.]HEU5469551.1 hypothetical protein [Actinophytocola sp.]